MEVADPKTIGNPLPRKNIDLVKSVPKSVGEKGTRALGRNGRILGHDRAGEGKSATLKHRRNTGRKRKGQGREYFRKKEQPEQRSEMWASRKDKRSQRRERYELRCRKKSAAKLYRRRVEKKSGKKIKVD